MIRVLEKNLKYLQEKMHYLIPKCSPVQLVKTNREVFNFLVHFKIPLCIWFWISIKFCTYQYVTLPFLWNLIFDQSRTSGGNSCHLQFSTADKQPWFSKWHQLLFTFRSYTYRMSGQTKYTRKWIFNLRS